MATSTQLVSILAGVVTIGLAVSARADIDPVTGEMGRGDAAAQSFAEFCRDELPADRKDRFYIELDNADRALVAGNVETAGDALNKARQATFRGGGETDASVRCLGEQATRRWFNTRLELWRRGSLAGLGGGMGRDYATLYVVAADRGADGIVDVVSKRPAEDFVWAYHSVEDIVEVFKWTREFGTLLLPEEGKIEKAARESLPALQDYAKREITATLAAEDQAFNRPATQMERDAAERIGDIGKLAESMAGVDTGMADQQQLLLVSRQVDESRALLAKVRGLEVAPVFGYTNDPMPSAIRAEKRGDIMFERGNDESLTLEFREELYEMSMRYYGSCNCRDQVAIVAEFKEVIQPALQAERAEQQQKTEKMQAEMQQQAGAMQKSIDDMQKTEAEKQSFKDEADALEAELDF